MSGAVRPPPRPPAPPSCPPSPPMPPVRPPVSPPPPEPPRIWAWASGAVSRTAAEAAVTRNEILRMGRLLEVISRGVFFAS
ncbi:hypothetical protein DDF67_03690 [Caulobacter endophyticus]|uniref:Uncharacterized protein n=1 Tax=Caulobacter endophyticus TaxID=2172652 RepID=A0A2T9KBI6_9CAUL|nr:hypothetical protein DDF67_03690 [Caulobacter endophyticus]